MNQIAIIGTGLIGTSLGMAIKRFGGRDTQIVGTDIKRGRASKAQSMGAIDRVSGSLAGAVEDAQIVIIATPVLAMKEVLETIGPRLAEGCLVTDTGTSKAAVLEWAEEYLPRSVSFVGGNPVVEKEGDGPEAAGASIFRDRPYCLISGTRARQDAVRVLTDLVRSIGAKPYFIGVAEHDSFAAAVNHLPILLSMALVGCTSKSPSWGDIAQVASTAYRDVSRPASDEPSTPMNMIAANSEDIIHWIDAFIKELYEIRRIFIEGGEDKPQALEKLFTQAYEARNRWITGAMAPEFRDAGDRVRIPSASENVASLFTGDSKTRRRIFGWAERGDTGGKKKR